MLGRESVRELVAGPVTVDSAALVQAIASPEQINVNSVDRGNPQDQQQGSLQTRPVERTVVDLGIACRLLIW